MFHRELELLVEETCGESSAGRVQFDVLYPIAGSLPTPLFNAKAGQDRASPKRIKICRTTNISNAVLGVDI